MIYNSLSEDQLKELDNAYSREYSQSVKDSMEDYSRDSNIVNDCLRNHGGKWNSDLEEKYGFTENQFKNMVENLDNSQIKLLKDTTLFRGCKNNITDFTIGKEIHDWGYGSTSFDKAVAMSYVTDLGTVLYIDASKGTKGIYIRQNSLNPEEVEFLLPRGTVLEVYKIDKSTGVAHAVLKYI